MNVSPESASLLITLITGIALGMVAGGGSVLFVVHKLRNDAAMMAALEKLADSWPAETKDVLKQFVPGLRDAADVLEEITDGVPVESKTQPQQG